MAEIRTVTTLRAKRAEIEGAVAAYERKLAQARADLASITATITIFEASGYPEAMPRYVDVHRLYKRGELWTICKVAFEAEGPLDTRELAVRVIRAKGLDEGDSVLRLNLTFRCVQALRMQMKRGKVATAGKRRGAWVWRAL